MTLDDLRRRATIADVLLENLYVRPGAEAVTDGTRRLSWKELHQAALAACAQFAALGVRSGDRVALALPNQIETVVLYWACALSGAVLVGANPRLGHDDLEGVLRHSGACLAFVAEDALAQRIAALQLPQMREIITIETSDPVSLFGRAVPSGALVASVVREDVFCVSYTSGTTGRPKGALLSHGNLVWNAAVVCEILRYTDRDTVLLAVPITHIFGLSPGLLASAVAGARVVVLKTFAAGAALDLCEWENVTVLHGTPTMFVLELAAQRRAPRDLRTLRTGIVAAAPVTPDLVDAIRSELRCDVQIGWGLTETSPCVTMTQFDDPAQERRCSVGRPVRDAHVLIDEGSSEFSEILVKSPGVFQGYYNDEEQTAAAFTPDGWFRTGDLGYIDDQQFLHVRGRCKDVVIRGGLHVYPDEVERVLVELPWVDAVAVVGIPDAVLGERTCACVVIGQNPPPPAEVPLAVRAAVAQRLADYKVPDTVLCVDELPRNAGGKVLRTVLSQHAVARVAGS